MTSGEVEQLMKRLTELALDLTADIPLAKTREEHIRVTARANRATELLNLLKTAESTDV